MNETWSEVFECVAVAVYGITSRRFSVVREGTVSIMRDIICAA